MKFYDRKEEIKMLRDTALTSKRSARFTVVTGRRRIGKTRLITQAYDDDLMLYFFVARKSEKDLCESFAAEMEAKLGIPIVGKPEKFSDLFETLMKISLTQNFTLVIDEFQDFLRVNPSVFSDMQRIWDTYHNESKINLVVSGSIYRLMTKIFKDHSEPLYGRQTGMIHVRPFGPEVLKEILRDYNPDYSNNDLLALYTFTGGVAKYIEVLMDNGAFTKEQMLRNIISRDSIFVNEGKFLLIDEFGKDFGTYFSILTAISSGKTSRKEIEDVVGREVGGYLTRLEDEYELIAKRQPLFEKTTNKNIRYCLNDRFLTFWFRFVYKYGYMVEIDAFDQLRAIIERDYSTFAGKSLEQYFIEQAKESRQYTRIGRWWDRKGENEIDLICENEILRKVTFAEVKLNPENYRRGALEEKVATFERATGEFEGYEVELRGLSVEEM